MTASGKSALAIELAKNLNGKIINADSAQVYADLHVLTARPSFQEESEVPHALYGHVDGAKSYSAGNWAKDVVHEIDSVRAMPILTGGTGLYFKALFDGLADIPPVPTQIREKWRRDAQQRPPGELYALLQQCDPVTALRLQVNDRQRITRALEVFEASGEPLSILQTKLTRRVKEKNKWLRIVVSRGRLSLDETVAIRFERMLESGAIDEVQALLARNLDLSLPVMKAIGVRELSAYLSGRLTLNEAKEKAIVATRQYAKRQETWFRNQMSDWHHVTADKAQALVENSSIT